MKTIIVLVMHGTPPRDFPRQELAEFFRLHSTIEGKNAGSQEALFERYSLLDSKIRNWPRNEQNDPFHAASLDLARHLSEVSGYEVIVGYNEFCAPSINEALETAIIHSAERILVATPMMTRGGEHAEKEIPAEIARFRESHPDIEIVYTWPFDTRNVAGFLFEHISRFN
jgi:sirohydrochlorin cobaltochelatase